MPGSRGSLNGSFLTSIGHLHVGTGSVGCVEGWAKNWGGGAVSQCGEKALLGRKSERGR